MPDIIGLDFETYGATSLPEHGLYRYTECPTFRPLIASTVTRRSDGNIWTHRADFVRNGHSYGVDRIGRLIEDRLIVAHNAGFERQVLRTMGIDLPASRFLDTAVIARAMGASGHLEGAAPQLLHTDKMPEGRNLIRLFSIPGKYQEKYNTLDFCEEIINEYPQEWSTFGKYCDLDAELGLRIAEDWIDSMTPTEKNYTAVTMEMNQLGWHVDVELVEEMQRRYLANQEEALERFRSVYDTNGEFNLNSHKQLKEWTEARGVKCKSFDEKHVARYLEAVNKKLFAGQITNEQRSNYHAVRALLETKQILGGSSLKKLKVILNTVSADDRLRDQYIHIGAGQTWRTTGRSAQMQNLKRLGGEPDDMSELHDEAAVWDNGKLADNIRQVFTATDPNGSLLVGDFRSVEAVGLAWLAGESWKVQAFRMGRDLYKSSAERQFGTPYDLVNDDQRRFGKVGELSCGYQAGASAVQSFADGMGVKLTEAEAAQVVYDWRGANPCIVGLWEKLDEMLHDAVENRSRTTFRNMDLPDGLQLRIMTTPTPQSLLNQHATAKSVVMMVVDRTGTAILKRYFHGCYVRGRNICYYKASDRKTGDLWRPTFTDSKTGQTRFYEIYGGKLAGILTQSFCRELFMQALLKVHHWTEAHPQQLKLVGQFHDEIVVDWSPGPLHRAEAMTCLEDFMSDPGFAASFPLAAEVKNGYRYIK